MKPCLNAIFVSLPLNPVSIAYHMLRLSLRSINPVRSLRKEKALLPYCSSFLPFFVFTEIFTIRIQAVEVTDYSNLIFKIKYISRVSVKLSYQIRQMIYET